MILEMATQEITTETEPVEKEIQPVEKEIQPVEKETQPMDAEFLSLENRENIRWALERNLNKKGVKYEVISHTDSQNAERDDNNHIGYISLANRESNRVIPYTCYDNEHMIHKEESAHVFTKYICTSIIIHDRRYLYVWTHEGRYYAMAPYFVSPSVKEDSDILCSNRLDVTKAVLSKDPVKALIEALKQLANRSNNEKGFDKDMYHWDTDETDDKFTVSKPSKPSKPTTKKKEDSWYWKVGEGNCTGKMVLTTNQAKKAELKYTNIS